MDSTVPMTLLFKLILSYWKGTKNNIFKALLDPEGNFRPATRSDSFFENQFYTHAYQNRKALSILLDKTIEDLETMPLEKFKDVLANISHVNFFACLDLFMNSSRYNKTSKHAVIGIFENYAIYNGRKITSASDLVNLIINLKKNEVTFILIKNGYCQMRSKHDEVLKNAKVWKEYLDNSLDEKTEQFKDALLKLVKPLPAQEPPLPAKDAKLLQNSKSSNTAATNSSTSNTSSSTSNTLTIPSITVDLVKDNLVLETTMFRDQVMNQLVELKNDLSYISAQRLHDVSLRDRQFNQMWELINETASKTDLENFRKLSSKNDSTTQALKNMESKIKAQAEEIANLNQTLIQQHGIMQQMCAMLHQWMTFSQTMPQAMQQGMPSFSPFFPQTGRKSVNNNPSQPPYAFNKPKGSRGPQKPHQKNTFQNQYTPPTPSTSADHSITAGLSSSQFVDLSLKMDPQNPNNFQSADAPTLTSDVVNTNPNQQPDKQDDVVTTSSLSSPLPPPPLQFGNDNTSSLIADNCNWAKLSFQNKSVDLANDALNSFVRDGTSPDSDLVTSFTPLNANILPSVSSVLKSVAEPTEPDYLGANPFS